MTDHSRWTRRSFLGQAAAALAAPAIIATATGSAMGPRLSQAAAPAAPEKFAWPNWPVIVFTKVHHKDLKLTYEETADCVAETGFDGIECPVRPGDQVEPERVADDLPRMAELMKKRNLRLHCIATSIVDLRTPHAEKVLRTAAALGVRYYRLGFITVKGGKADDKKISEVKAQLKDIVALNSELGLCGMHQNHLGDYFGADTWAIYKAVKDFDPRAIGMAFDIGHAAGAHEADWLPVFQQVRSHIAMAQCKDYDVKTKAWVPLGQGSVDKAFFSALRRTGYANAINMHFEYEVEGGSPAALRKNMMAAMKKDQALLRRWIRESAA